MKLEKAKLSGRFNMDPAIASPHAAGLCVGTFVTAKPYQDDVDVILGGMVLARDLPRDFSSSCD
jgi:hypothetical protein